MSTYIKSVSNSIEQGRDFPVVNFLEDMSNTYENIHVASFGRSAWIKNNSSGGTDTFYVSRVRFSWDSILVKTNEEIYRNWRKRFIPLQNTYGYGGNNRYSLRFNIGNKKYFCTDAYNTSISTGITSINDIWNNNSSRKWEMQPTGYPSMGFSVNTGNNEGMFGGWISVVHEGKTYIVGGYCTKRGNDDYTFPFQGKGYADFYCLNDIPDFEFQDVVEKSDEYGYYSEGGGYGGGSFDDSSDAFGLPSLPSLGVSEVGFINVYNPSKGQLQGFADELFPDFQMPTPSTATGIEAVAENLANTFEVLGDFAESYVNAGLINYVIDCHIIPVAPVTSGTSNIKVGFKTFNYSPAKVTSDYVEFDCGSLEIAEYYQNFLDYEGTKAKLYLPFIGFVDIKPEWFQSGKLGVTYHFNIIDGSCIAFVIATSSKSKLKNTVVATFGGNCCVHMPITGVNYSSMISGVVGGAVGIASNASNMIKTNQKDKGTVMSNIEGATGIASNLADAVGSKPSIEQSNGYNAGMSFMCYRRPYLLIERPVASFSKDYPKEQGLPLNVTKKLGTMKGFTTCTAPIVDNFHCLEEEKEMIKQALIEGTIF